MGIDNVRALLVMIDIHTYLLDPHIPNHGDVLV
jgi:hypothetical protein